jgi:hypothetical protein
MMSCTVNIPAKRDVSLFHSGAETTPAISCLSLHRLDLALKTRTIIQQTLQRLLDLELGIEDDDPEADRERIVGYPRLQELPNVVQSCFMSLGCLIRWQIRGSAWPSGTLFASHFRRRIRRRERGVHRECAARVAQSATPH